MEVFLFSYFKTEHLTWLPLYIICCNTTKCSKNGKNCTRGEANLFGEIELFLNVMIKKNNLEIQEYILLIQLKKIILACKFCPDFRALPGWER